jgi:ferredoxin
MKFTPPLNPLPTRGGEGMGEGAWEVKMAVVADLDKCVGCGYCQMVCPREALRAYGHIYIDKDRCTECYEGVHRFDKNEPISDRKATLDQSFTHWWQLCLYTCPMGALSLEKA